MADYSKWKVTELKAELKRRGVPQTGLKLKQDFINKLTELDSEAHEEPLPEGASPKPPSEQKEDKDTKDADTTNAKSDEPPVPEPPAETLPTQDASALQDSGQDRVASESRPVSEPKDDAPAVDHSELPQAEQPVALGSGGKVQEIVESARSRDDESREAEEAPTTGIAAETPMAVEPSSSAPSELENEMRKRKRRSNSPPPTEETIKKSKVDNKSPSVVLKEDVLSDTVTPAAEAAIQQPPVAAETVKEKEEDTRRPARSDLEMKEDISAERRDRRFEDLLPPNERKRTPSPGPPEDDREVEPALHPATPAIYIRGLMRPLQPASLKRYLISLASADNDPKILLNIFLDPIKTHCFAVFNSVSAASHVRSKLHGSRWPNERDRKPLWADFIPEDKVSEWIKTEESASQGRAGPRWEVVYERTENGYSAFLQEFRGAPAGPVPARRQSMETGLRRDSQPIGRSPPAPAPAPPERVGEGFKALDERFLSTKTKPKLYYLPVPRDVIDKRLEQFAALSRKGSQHRRPGGDETRRITFEDVDVFVDDGPEYAFARNRGGRRPGRGPWRGRAR